MPDEELLLVKNIMIGEMMRILDGPFGIADVTIENILCGRDHTVIGENIRRIQAMTPARRTASGAEISRARGSGDRHRRRPAPEGGRAAEEGGSPVTRNRPAAARIDRT